MDRFRRVFRGREREWSLGGVSRGWGDAPSIATFIASNLDADGRFTGGDLPDTAPAEPGGLRWAPGALDGVMGHHAGRTESALGPIVAALRVLAGAPSAEGFRSLAAAARGESMLQLADPLLRVLPDSGLPAPRVGGIGRVLAAEAPDRELVKLGIVLLGIAGSRDVDLPLLLRLGAHDELALFAIVAMRRLGAGDGDLWRLARRLDGWGRIHAVERLAGTDDPAINAWLLREGFRNSVMNEYLAHTCATQGGLASALAAGEIDGPLFTGATDILAALVNGGPTEDLSDYAEAEMAVARWLDHAERRPRTPPVVVLLDQLADHDVLSADLRARLAVARDDPASVEAVVRGLDDDDLATFSAALDAAPRRALDAFTAIARRLRTSEDPYGFLVFRLLQAADAARIEEALEIVRPSIDPAVIATGPGTELGLGPGFAAHQQLDSVLGALARFPGHGGDLVLLALRSSVIRNRNLALTCLDAWGEAHWPAGTRWSLEQAIRVEPDAGVAERIRALMG